MLARPETKYADADGVRIAYQVFGEGGRTLIGIPGFAQHVELLWDEPHANRFLERLASMCRVIHFDKRGTGLSDRRLPAPGLDARVQDLVAVMAAERVERAIVAGFSEGGTMAAFFAATFPERTEGLVLSGTYSSLIRADDHPWAPSKRRKMLEIRAAAALWGTGQLFVSYLGPSLAGSKGFRRWAAHYERKSLARSSFPGYARLATELDIRHVLSSIYAPTLVMHARGDRLIPLESGRYVSEHIVGARFLELPTSDHVIWFGAQDMYLDAMEEFLTGTRPSASHHHKLATVLFIDIVDSTAQATRVGDAAWRDLLDRHDRLSRIEIGICGGRWIKSTGDGLLATFESPSRAVQCAWTLRDRFREELGISIRAGLHTGEVELRGDDISGIAVHQASRVQEAARSSEVLVTSAVRDLVAGSGIDLADRGAHALKGISGPCQLFDVQRVSAP